MILIRKSLLLVLFVVTGGACFGQKLNPEYDSLLARRLGADERGMKMYVFVILKTGPNNMAAGAERDSLFLGHFSNMNAMAEQGKLVVAGPFEDNANNYRGLFILNVKTEEEALQLLQGDPTIRSKIFDVELYGWYGSAAISEYLQFDNKLRKNL
jgi:uncharacterized protein YciI